MAREPAMPIYQLAAADAWLELGEAARAEALYAKLLRWHAEEGPVLSEESRELAERQLQQAKDDAALPPALRPLHRCLRQVPCFQPFYEYR